MPEPTAAPVRVIYVLCNGRSGSTVTGLTLGAHPEVANLGEVNTFWKHFASGKRERNEGAAPFRCSCGEPLAACPHWQAVLDRLEAETGARVPDVRAPGAAFGRVNAALFRAALDVQGRRVVLDKSKKLGRCLRLVGSPQFEVTVLHVVRDGRAVANSFRQRGVRLDREAQLKFNFYKNVGRWAGLNEAMALRLGRHPRYVRVRYEDFVAHPERELTRILDAAGLPYEPAMLRFGDSVQHEMGGNRMRNTGVREIRPDLNYLREVTGREWALGTALAAPVLLQMGYPLGRDAMRARLAPSASGAPVAA